MKEALKDRETDYLVFTDKEVIVLEVRSVPERLHLRAFAEKMMQMLGIKPQEKEEPGYRKIGKYRVKEIFAGEESLTSLLTQYVERTVSMRC